MPSYTPPSLVISYRLEPLGASIELMKWQGLKPSVRFCMIIEDIHHIGSLVEPEPAPRRTACAYHIETTHALVMATYARNLTIITSEEHVSNMQTYACMVSYYPMKFAQISDLHGN
jgi:hypothetical protein